LAIAAAVAAAFFPSLRNGFVSLDGNDNFVFNANYSGVHWWHWRWMFGTSFFTGNFEPLHWLSLSLVYRLAGMQPAAYHALGLACHALACVLLYFVCLELGLGPAGGAFAALSFALHPLRVESVAWITAQHYPLAAAFYLFSLLSYLKSCRPYGAADALRWRRLSLAGFAASLFSFPAGVTLPFVLLVLDLCPLRRLPLDPGQWNMQAARPVLREKLPFLILAVAGAAVIFTARAVTRNLLPVSELGLGSRILLGCHSLWFFAMKTVWPMRLSPVYELPYPLQAWRWLPAAAAAATVSTLAFSWRWRLTPAFALWCAYVLCALPVCGLTTSGTQVSADRYTYFPGMVLSFAAAAALVHFLSRRNPTVRLAGGIICVAVLLGLGRLTWLQCGIWKDSQSVWDHVRAVDPMNGTAEVGYGYGLLEEGRPVEAVQAFKDAMRLNPRLIAPYYALGYTLAREGHDSEALGFFNEVVRKDPYFAAGYNAIGSELAKAGNFVEAVPYFEKTLTLRPDHDRAQFNLALALSELGRQDEAAAHYRQALRLNPDFSQARQNLAALTASRGARP
jgi:tetratricopeptide (TPR) repeat protein